jgi:hypothetical protein
LKRVDDMPESCNPSIRCERPEVHCQVADALAVRAVNKLQAHRNRDAAVAVKERERLEADGLELSKAREERRRSVAALSLRERLQARTAPVVLPRPASDERGSPEHRPCRTTRR